MKKLFLLGAMLVSMACNAQSTYRFQDTQARLLDVNSDAYVKPLVVDLVVDNAKGRVKDDWNLTKDQAEKELKGDISNIRSYAVFMSSQKHNCDVIVAGTFHIRTNDAGNGYVVTLVGYPASFKNWKSVAPTDYEWIRLKQSIDRSDVQKTNAVRR